MEDEILGEFIVDSRENLEKASEYLLLLEKTPEDPELLNGLLRHLHSIKGNAGFLDLQTIFSLIHKVENILQGLRQTKTAPSQSLMDLILKVLDELTAQLSNLEVNLTERPDSIQKLLDEMDNEENGKAIVQPQKKPKKAVKKRTPEKSASKPVEKKVSADVGKIEGNWQIKLVKPKPSDLKSGAPRFAAETAGVMEGTGITAMVVDLREVLSLKNMEIGSLVTACYVVRTKMKVGFILDKEKQAGLLKAFKLIELNKVFEFADNLEEIQNLLA